MISDWMIDVALGFALWFLDLLPPIHLDPQFLDGSYLQLVLDWFDGLGVWVVWPVVVLCVSTVAGTWLLGFGVKALRALIAHIPFVGGKGD